MWIIQRCHCRPMRAEKFKGRDMFCPVLTMKALLWIPNPGIAASSWLRRLSRLASRNVRLVRPCKGTYGVLPFHRNRIFTLAGHRGSECQLPGPARRQHALAELAAANTCPSCARSSKVASAAATATMLPLLCRAAIPVPCGAHHLGVSYFLVQGACWHLLLLDRPQWLQNYY